MKVAKSSPSDISSEPARVEIQIFSQSNEGYVRTTQLACNLPSSDSDSLAAFFAAAAALLLFFAAFLAAFFAAFFASAFFILSLVRAIVIQKYATKCTRSSMSA